MQQPRKAASSDCNHWPVAGTDLQPRYSFPLAAKRWLQTKLRLTQDIAFVTFDTYPYSVLIEPTPTIIDIDVYDLGIQAAIMLQRKIENPSLLIQSYATLPVLKRGETTVDESTMDKSTVGKNTMENHPIV